MQPHRGLHTAPGHSVGVSQLEVGITAERNSQRPCLEYAGILTAPAVCQGTLGQDPYLILGRGGGVRKSAAGDLSLNLLVIL